MSEDRYRRCMELMRNNIRKVERLEEKYKAVRAEWIEKQAKQHGQRPGDEKTWASWALEYSKDRVGKAIIDELVTARDKAHLYGMAAGVEREDMLMQRDVRMVDEVDLIRDQLIKNQNQQRVEVWPGLEKEQVVGRRVEVDGETLQWTGGEWVPVVWLCASGCTYKAAELDGRDTRGRKHDVMCVATPNGVLRG